MHKHVVRNTNREIGDEIQGLEIRSWDQKTSRVRGWKVETQKGACKVKTKRYGNYTYRQLKPSSLSRANDGGRKRCRRRSRRQSPVFPGRASRRMPRDTARIALGSLKDRRGHSHDEAGTNQSASDSSGIGNTSKHREASVCSSSDTAASGIRGPSGGGSYLKTGIASLGSMVCAVSDRSGGTILAMYSRHQGNFATESS